MKSPSSLVPLLLDVDFDPGTSDLTGGVYFYRLEAGSFTESRMMVVVR